MTETDAPNYLPCPGPVLPPGAKDSNIMQFYVQFLYITKTVRKYSTQNQKLFFMPQYVSFFSFFIPNLLRISPTGEEHFISYIPNHKQNLLSAVLVLPVPRSVDLPP